MKVLTKQKVVNEVRVPSFSKYKKGPAQDLEQSVTSKKTKIQTSQQQTIEGHEWLGAAALSSLIFGYTMREAIVNDEPIGYVIGFGAAVFAVLTYGVWGTYKDEQSLESIRVQTPQRVKESMIQVRDLSPKYSHNHSYLFGPGMRI